MVQHVGFIDWDPMFLVFDLVHVQLRGKGCDMRVGHVDPRREEVYLDGKLLLGHDDVPHLYLIDHRLDGLIL